MHDDEESHFFNQVFQPVWESWSHSHLHPHFQSMYYLHVAIQHHSKSGSGKLTLCSVYLVIIRIGVIVTPIPTMHYIQPVAETALKESTNFDTAYLPR